MIRGLDTTEKTRRGAYFFLLFPYPLNKNTTEIVLLRERNISQPQLTRDRITAYVDKSVSN